MPKSLILSALTGAMMLTTVSSVSAAGGDIDIPRQNWSWDGIFGTFDRAEAQRGLQVYKEVCAGCHSLPLRRLSQSDAARLHRESD